MLLVHIQYFKGHSTKMSINKAHEYIYWQGKGYMAPVDIYACNKSNSQGYHLASFPNGGSQAWLYFKIRWRNLKEPTDAHILP